MANDSSTSWTLGKDFKLSVSWKIIYLVESFLVCFGNSLSILVFWRRRRSLRRTSYLLINLAVADFSYGMCTACNAAIMHFKAWNREISYVVSFINTLALHASIFFLTLVSLETAYAIVFPFRHRTATRRSYFFAETLVWILAALVSFLNSLLFVYSQYFFLIVIVGIIGVCLILLVSAYFLIWWSVTKRPTRQMRERDQRKKLSVTLFVVTVLSLMTWIPGLSAPLSHVFKELQFKDNMHILQVVVLANSFLNPLVYTFRMPEFRNEIKLIICKLPCRKLRVKAAAPSSPACHIISMSIINPAHEIQVLSPRNQSQERNDNNANQLQFQSESINPGFI